LSYNISNKFQEKLRQSSLEESNKSGYSVYLQNINTKTENINTEDNLNSSVIEKRNYENIKGDKKDSENSIISRKFGSFNNYKNFMSRF